MFCNVKNEFKSINYEISVHYTYFNELVQKYIYKLKGLLWL